MKFKGHGVDGGADVVENAGDVEEHFVGDKQRRRHGLTAVNDQQALYVERRPAHEKRHHHRHCKSKKYTTSITSEQ